MHNKDEKPLAFALVGYGAFGQHYARLLQELEGVYLHTIVTSSASARVEPSFPAGVEHSFKVEDVFNNSEIEAVIIATPISTHYALAASALAKKKHVLLEKPMCATAAEAISLKEDAKKADFVFMVGYQYVYNDFILALQKEIHKGTLGHIRYIMADHLYCNSIRSDAGSFLDAAAHALSLIEHLIHPGKFIEAVGMKVDIANRGFDDFSAAVIKFENGIVADIRTSWFAPQKIMKFVLIGESGMAVFNDSEPAEKLQLFHVPYPFTELPKNGKSLFMGDKKITLTVPSIQPREPLRNELLHFIECIRTKKTPITDAEFGSKITEWQEVIISHLRQ